MSYSKPDGPVFSWSNSRDRMFAECPRKYDLNYYGAAGGWDAEAPAEAQLAYRLKKLDSLPMLLGKLVHECARRYAVAIKEGTSPLPLDSANQWVRQQMREAWRSSMDRERFMRSPGHHPMLQERYYPDRMPSSEKLAAISGKIDLLLENLYDWPGWESIRRSPPSEIFALESLDSVDYLGHPLYAVPDLVYHDPDVGWTVLDWKTGREDGVELQLALYVVYGRASGIIPTSTESVLGRVVNLKTAEDRIGEVTAADVTAAEQRITDSTTRMAEFLVDQDTSRNQSVPLPCIPWPASTAQCRWCPFLEACQPEIEARSGDGPF